jgi:polysaccharide biosynthesis transport protein
MRSLVEGLGRHLDLVIIDTPPLGPVVDGVIVAQLAEAIVYVAKWGETPREAVENSLHALPDARNVAGLVLNLVDEAKIAKFGKYAFYGYAEFAKYYQD